MRRSLLWLGLVFSAAYCLVMWWTVGDRFGSLKTMDLNSVGDFLAGAFSPLAFLWLVLGFIQQGFELRVSSDALRLQAKELKESVAQQAELALATKMSLKNQAVTFEPVFQVKFAGLSDEFDQGKWVEASSFELHNVGAPCEQVKARIMGDNGVEEFCYSFPIIKRDGAVGFQVSGMRNYEVAKLRVNYSRFDATEGVQFFDLTPASNPDDPSEWVVMVEKMKSPTL